MRILIVISLCMLAAVSAWAADNVIEPLGLTNATLGGGQLNEYTPGVTDGTGLNNIGLLVRCWGRVTHVDNGFFYISDGSAAPDGSTFEGIRVSITSLAPGNTITAPQVGKFIAITGISSTSSLNARIIPTLRPRRQADIVEIM